MRRLPIALAVLALVACGESAEQPGPLDLAQLAAEAEEHDGERVELTAGYYGAFEVSVLTPGFAESYPPQPMEPQVWVNGSPPARCLERAQRVAWAEGVRAMGVFRYDPAGGFGHLGAYEMALEDATLSCA